MSPRRLALLAVLILAPLTAAAQSVVERAFPERGVRIVMPWPPGGGTDILGRAFADRLSREWGQPVVVDNRAGANGILGTVEAARAHPDGYTLLMATADTHAINPAIRSNLGYDPLRDFVPVVWASTQPLILCVHPALPARTAAEFVDLARARPGEINIASWGSGSTAHMAAELLQLRTGTRLTHVPYRGAAPALTDLMAGQVQAMFTGPFTANQHHPAGRIRCLATGTETRPATAPDYPTFAEAGFPGVLGGTWFGLVAPAGTPAPVLAALRAAAARAGHAGDPGAYCGPRPGPGRRRSRAVHGVHAGGGGAVARGGPGGEHRGGVTLGGVTLGGVTGDAPSDLPDRAALSVAFVLLPHFTLLPFAGFVDTLRLAADEGDLSRPRACRWTIMAPDMAPVRASCGAEITPWETLGAPERFDYVVVVGGLLHRGGPGLNPAVAAFLRDAAKRRVTVIGICTGSLALAEAGVLKPGRRACVSWYHYADLQDRHPGLHPVADRLWLQEGRVITCAGGAAAVDLAASLVQAHLGGSAAQKSLHIMLLDRPRAGGAAQPQPPNTVPVANARVRRAMGLIEQNLSAPLSADAIAARVAISRRQLERLFRGELGTSVQTFARDLRLSYAVWQLAHSDARITDVALGCGFADPAHFNRHFRAAFGRTPSEARRAGPAALRAMLSAWWPYSGAPPGPSGAPGDVPGESGTAATAAPLRVFAPADRRPYA